MLGRLIRKSGMTVTIIIVTGLVTIASSILYLLVSNLTGGTTIQGIFHSIFIPLVIAPVFLFFFLRVVIRLDRSEQALSESEEKYRTILDSIEDGYFEVDIAGRLTFFNDSLCRILGYSRSELKGLNYRAFMDAGNAARVFETFNRVFQTGVADKGFDWEIIKKDGKKRHLDTSVSLKRQKDGRAVGFQGVARDITNRNVSERALRDSEEKYRQLVNFAPAAICEIDVATGKFISFNKILPEYTGYSREELFSMKIGDLLSDDSRSRFIERARQVRQGKDISGTIEYRIKTRYGGDICFMVNSRYFFENDQAVRVTIVAHNITEIKAAEQERKKLEDQLRQSQKMEAIGTLAAGIAHDFNNILSAILGYAELSQLHVPKNSDAERYLNKMDMACRQAKELIRQILAFSRQNDPDKTSLAVNAVISEAMKMVSPSLPADIHIRPKLHPASGVIDADPVQIQQVLLNLFSNAGHAMKESGGVIDVQALPVDLTRAEATAVPGLKGGPYVKISIRDAGKGMSRDVMERVFDPYYTTKQTHEGTGLGLAIVRNIVVAHDGAVAVESVPGRGSVFHVYLPRSFRAMLETVNAGDGMQNVFRSLSFGNERILFVDDEENIAIVGRELLEHLGYVVEIQTCGITALKRFAGDPAAFDLIITDMVMPDMTGDLLAKEILALRPDMPIIMCTGHSESISEAAAKAIGIKAFVPKPYRIFDFSHVIRSVLDAPVQ
jgi:PAS domain S-box-containing protein